MLQAHADARSVTFNMHEKAYKTSDFNHQPRRALPVETNLLSFRAKKGAEATLTAKSQVRGANHSYTPVETKLLSINQAAPEQILQNLACWNEATFAHPNTTVNVTTPPLYQGDIWRTGVRPSGNYWGSMGENIDLLSGNLNFNLPLLKAQSRGFGATFTLSYNSQQCFTHGGISHLRAEIMKEVVGSHGFWGAKSQNPFFRV